MKDRNLTIKDSSISFLAGFFISQLAVVLISVLCFLIAKASGFSFENFIDFSKTAVGYLIMIIALDLGLFFVSFYYKRKTKVQLFQKLSIKKVLIYILIAVLVYFMLMPIVNSVDFGLTKLGVKPSYIPYDLTIRNYFISLISLVILPAICEELLFRGIIFNGLKEKGPIFAILISDLMFSIFHTSINQLFYPFVMGCLLSAVMAKENNIFYPILIHLINNFISLTLSFFNVELFFITPIYFIVAIALFILFVVLLCLYIKKFVIVKNDEPKETNENNNNQKQIKKNYIYLIISFVVMAIFWIIVNIYS